MFHLLIARMSLFGLVLCLMTRNKDSKAEAKALESRRQFEPTFLRIQNKLSTHEKMELPVNSSRGKDLSDINYNSLYSSPGFRKLPHRTTVSSKRRVPHRTTTYENDDPTQLSHSIDGYSLLQPFFTSSLSSLTKAIDDSQVENLISSESKEKANNKKLFFSAKSPINTVKKPKLTETFFMFSDKEQTSSDHLKTPFKDSEFANLESMLQETGSSNSQFSPYSDHQQARGVHLSSSRNLRSSESLYAALIDSLSSEQEHLAPRIDDDKHSELLRIRQGFSSTSGIADLKEPRKTYEETSKSFGWTPSEKYQTELDSTNLRTLQDLDKTTNQPAENMKDKTPSITEQNKIHPVQRINLGRTSNANHKNNIRKRSVYSLQDRTTSRPYQTLSHSSRAKSLINFSDNLLNAGSSDSWQDFYKIENQKREFDTIGSGVLSGIGQNYLGKRQFDSIYRGSGISGIEQNYLNSKFVQPSERRPIKSGTGQNILVFSRYSRIPDYVRSYLFNNVPDGKLYDSGNVKIGIFSAKRSFDSISVGALNGLQQHFVTKNKLGAGLGVIDRPFRGKRLEAISNDALGGIRQNFLDKKLFDSLSKMSIQLIPRTYFPRRNNYSSRKDFMEAVMRNIKSKRNADLLAQDLHWSSEPFHEHKHFRVRKNSRHHSTGKHIIANRRTQNEAELNTEIQTEAELNTRVQNEPEINLENQNEADERNFRYNFQQKRSFDPIATYDSLSGLSQNFIGSFSSTKPRRIRNLPWMTFQKRNEDYFPISEQEEVEDDGEDGYQTSRILPPDNTDTETNEYTEENDIITNDYPDPDRSQTNFIPDHDNDEPNYVHNFKNEDSDTKHDNTDDNFEDRPGIDNENDVARDDISPFQTLPLDYH